MRIDKFLVECGVGSRKEVKELLKSRKIQVNGVFITSPKENIEEEKDEVYYGEKKVKLSGVSLLYLT